MAQGVPENSHFDCFHSLKAQTNSSQYLSLIVAIGLRTKALAELIQRVSAETQKMIMKPRQTGRQK